MAARGIGNSVRRFMAGLDDAALRRIIDARELGEVQMWQTGGVRCLVGTALDLGPDWAHTHFDLPWPVAWRFDAIADHYGLVRATRMCQERSLRILCQRAGHVGAPETRGLITRNDMAQLPDGHPALGWLGHIPA